MSALERLALRYVERYATTRAKLAAYLGRKLRERGWNGDTEPGEAVAALVAKIAALRYVDDRQFAEMRSASLARRGYGVRRVGMALKAAGISVEDAQAALDQAGEGAWEAAMAFARRRRIGPFAEAPLDPAAQRKAFAALMRAGHSVEIARRILSQRAD